MTNLREEFIGSETSARTTRRPVIVLGTETPIGLAVLRDLGRHEYSTIGIGRQTNALGAASRYCHRHVVRPDNPKALISEIRALAKKYEAAYLLAVDESDILLLNRHRKVLGTSIQLLIPTADQFAQVVDKGVCQHHAENAGIRVPQTLRATSLKEVEAAASKLNYPVVMKWANPHDVARELEAAGMVAMKANYARNAQELLRQLAVYARFPVLPLIQEYCPGHGLGQMFLAVDGEVLIEFQHERIHEWPPEGGSSTLCKAIALSEHVECRKRSRALIRSLRWTGVAMVEYRFDPASEQYFFMEINGRFWGSLPLAIAAGVPFAAGLVAACGERTELPRQQRDYPNLFCLFWIPDTKRLLRILFNRNAIADPFFECSPLRELRSYCMRFLRPTTRYYVFSLTDPWPFFSDMAGVITKLTATLTKLPRLIAERLRQALRRRV